MTNTTQRDCAISKRLSEIFRKHQADFSGRVATYIPELAKADPAAFGIAVVALDGKTYEVGDSRTPFTIQSISKPFVYGLAMADSGKEEVLRRVGVEPSGDAFNSIIFDDRTNRPFNPMVNAGAIATTSLVKGDNHGHRLQRILDLFGRFAGEPLSIDDSVYQSEKSTGHRNRAITYLELNAGMINEPVEEHLDLYFRQCSILVNARHLAVMAATLANNGSNPITGERALDSEHVRSLLSIMSSCGMYDFSGEWIYRVGLPAKSGVAGGIVAVLPGQLGIGVYSPALDAQGNSVRGIAVCEDLSRHFNLHLFDRQMSVSMALRRTYRGNQVTSKRIRRPEERKILDRLGGAIQVHELQGSLFFASIERVVRAITSDLTGVRYIILDGRRVTGADRSARQLVAEERDALERDGIRVVLAGFPVLLREQMTSGPDAVWREEDFVDSVDEALERFENELIENDNQASRDDLVTPVPLRSMDIAAGFDDEEISILGKLVTQKHYAPGEAIITEGEMAGELFMLALGRATISVKLSGTERRRRLGAVSEGVTFGEISLFEGGPRTADVIAVTPVICYVLSIADLHDTAGSHPKLQMKILQNVGKTLARRLRQANAEIRALE